CFFVALPSRIVLRLQSGAMNRIRLEPLGSLLMVAIGRFLSEKGRAGSALLRSHPPGTGQRISWIDSTPLDNGMSNSCAGLSHQSKDFFQRQGLGVLAGVPAVVLQDGGPFVPLDVPVGGQVGWKPAGGRLILVLTLCVRRPPEQFFQKGYRVVSYRRI